MWLKQSCNYSIDKLGIIFWSKWPTYTFIHFPEKFPPIRLFSPIFLLVFQKLSHLYFYSEPSSIRNSRVLGVKKSHKNILQINLLKYSAKIEWTSKKRRESIENYWFLVEFHSFHNFGWILAQRINRFIDTH